LVSGAALRGPAEAASTVVTFLRPPRPSDPDHGPNELTLGAGRPAAVADTPEGVVAGVAAAEASCPRRRAVRGSSPARPPPAAGIVKAAYAHNSRATSWAADGVYSPGKAPRTSVTKAMGSTPRATNVDLSGTVGESQRAGTAARGSSSSRR
jgi:hypothetical protein